MLKTERIKQYFKNIMSKKDRKGKESKKRQFFEDNTSKIKDIYLELYNYSFYHAPLDEPDNDRFIGRERLLNKLETIINRNNSNSGVYLVTGYRGMGKTSFVNHVLNKITLTKTDFTRNIINFTKYFINTLAINILMIYIIYSSYKYPILNYIDYTLINRLNLEKSCLKVFWISLIVSLIMPIITVKRNLYLKRKPRVFKNRVSHLIKFVKNINKYKNIPIGDHLTKAVLNIFKSQMLVSYILFIFYFSISDNCVFTFIRNFLNYMILNITKTFGFLSDSGFTIISSSLSDSSYTIFSNWIDNMIICTTIFSCLIFVLYLSYILYLRISIYFKNENKKSYIFKDAPFIIGSAFFKILKLVYEKLINQKRRYIVIKLSLGFDKLTELEVMQLLARDIRRKYRDYLDHFTSKYFTSYFFNLIVFSLIYTFLLSSSLTEVKITTRIFLTKTYGSYLKNNHGTSDNPNLSIVIGSVVSEIKRESIYIYKFIRTIIIFKDVLPVSLYDFLYFLINFLFYNLILSIIMAITNRLYPNNYKNRKLKEVYNDICSLVERIDANIIVESNMERSVNMPYNWFFKYINRKQKNYPIANVREIEKDLIKILNKNNQYQLIYNNPQVIVVFDEMDKIEINSNSVLTEMAEADLLKSQNENQHNTIEHSRKRRSAVFSLLSNLKDFLNNSKAKFLFIAGHEMSDASLADVSDPESFTSSIFHEVINIDSFFSDKSDSKAMSITGITESYVCKYLFPIWYKSKETNFYKEYSLKEYESYLEKFFFNSDFPLKLTKIKIKKENEDIFIKELISNKISRGCDIKDYIHKILNGELIFLPDSYKNLYSIELKEQSESIIIDEIKKFDAKFIKKKKRLNFENLLEYLKGFYHTTKITDEDFIIFCLTLNNYCINKIHNFKYYYLSFILNKQKREKIIVNLQHFIVFLAYRSNGAPKKITNLFEKKIRFIRSRSELESAIVTGYCVNSLYLHFNYYTQYNLELINYLYNPVQLLVNATIKDYGDKLLVATSFIVDHIFKFHHTGFSDQDLEIMPEILTFNKTPNLREVIQRIIGHLSKTHLKKINNGLQDYVFTRRIVEEISFLSKVMESESAAFNFTLDESLSMKQYYNVKLITLEKKIHDYQNSHNLLKSIAYYHTIIGDLHYNDEEYIDALIHYNEAIQSLSITMKEDSNNLENYIKYLRIKIKYGLTHEKMGECDTALSIYENLTMNSIDKFLQYGESKLKKTEIEKILTEKLIANDELLHSQFAIFENFKLILQPLLAKLYVIEKNSPNGIVITDLIRVKMEFETFLQLARYEENINLITEFLRKLGNLFYYKNKKLILNEKDFNKIFDFIHQDIKLNICLDENCNVSCRCSQTNIFLCLKHINKDKIFIWDCNTVYSSCLNTYINLITNVASSFKNKTISENRQISLELALNISLLADSLLSCNNQERSSNHMIPIEFMNILSESIFIKETENSEANFFQNIINLFYHHEKSLNILSFKYKKKYDYVIYSMILNLISANIYYSINAYREQYESLRKILYYFSRTQIFKNNIDQTFINIVKKYILQPAIHALYRAYANIHRIEIQLTKSSFVDNPLIKNDSFDISRISLNADIKELIIIFEQIKLSLFNKNFHLYSPAFSKINSIATMTLSYNRIFELDMKSSINYKILKKLLKLQFNDEFDDSNNQLIKESINNIVSFILKKECENECKCERECRLNQDTIDYLSEIYFVYDKKEIIKIDLFDIIKFLILDSITNLFLVEKTINILGVSYKNSYCLFADIYYNMGKWCLMLNYLVEIIKNVEDENSILSKSNKEIELIIEKQIGVNGWNYLSPIYHKEKSLSFYKSAKEVHSEGSAYKDLISNMFFINDDFNSEMYHFSAALERYLLQSSSVEERIKKLSDSVNLSHISRYESYKLY